MKVKVPQPISGGLLLSYKCSAKCRHCMYACSPKWTEDWLSEKDLQTGLSCLAGKISPSPRGADMVGLNYGQHFTGGEPFLNFELLVKAVEMAAEFEIPSMFVETNCFWCKNDQVTLQKLERLKQAGLKGILISVNPFYAEYVPFVRTDRCVRLSQKVFAGNVMVYQAEYFKRFKQLGIKERIALEDYMVLTNNESLTQKVELFLAGRAAHQLRALYPAYPSERFFSEPCRPPFLRQWHNHFDNYGNLMPGYCGGISLGNWLNLDHLLKEGIDLEECTVLKFLISGNMLGLLYLARDFAYEESPGGYVSKCDLCLDIRKHLVSRKQFKELAPRAFYEHL